MAVLKLFNRSDWIKLDEVSGRIMANFMTKHVRIEKNKDNTWRVLVYEREVFRGTKKECVQRALFETIN